MKQCEEMSEYEITKEELRKIANTCIGMLKTEADSTSKHPELGHKVPILDLAVWVEEVRLPSPGLEDQQSELHAQCGEGEVCLPIGAEEVGEGEAGEQLEGGQDAACQPVPQVRFEFYRKPMAPTRTLMAESAQP